MHHFLACLLICLFFVPSLLAATPPNVVVIMTDDQGYGDFGATGNSLIRTPHLDALANQSTRWEQFYVSPVCSPTRACLMTGRYNHRTKCIDTFKGRSMMATDEVTVAELLREAGYATGIFGKWHLGDNYPMRPTDQGFDEALVHKGGGLAQPSEPIESQRRYTDPLLFHNNREVASAGYCTDVFFDHATEFVVQQADAGKPFFCYIPLNAPHGPFHDVPEELYREYQSVDFSSLVTNPRERSSQTNDRLARIAAMITNVDDNVGKFLAQLDRLGIADHTLVFFLTDNGPNTRRFVGPFRGKKSELYEGGIRTPLWVRWPQQLAPNQQITETVAAHIDVTPTILQACGVDIPDNLDGRSLLAKLRDPAQEMESRPLVIQYHRGDVASRYHSCMVRSGRWKLVHPSGTQKESYQGIPKWELYDLVQDPGERKDLAAQLPEQVSAMTEIYEAWFDDVTAERADMPGAPPIVIDPRFENPAILTWQDMIDGNWNTNRIGYYKLQIADAGRCDVRFESPPQHKIDQQQTWQAKLEIGDQVYEASFDPASRLALFRGVELPGGKTRLRPWIEAPSGEKLSVYHVWISSR